MKPTTSRYSSEALSLCVLICASLGVLWLVYQTGYSLVNGYGGDMIPHKVKYFRENTLLIYNEQPELTYADISRYNHDVPNDTKRNTKGFKLAFGLEYEQMRNEKLFNIYSHIDYFMASMTDEPDVCRLKWEQTVKFYGHNSSFRGTILLVHNV